MPQVYEGEFSSENCFFFLCSCVKMDKEKAQLIYFVLNFIPGALSVPQSIEERDRTLGTRYRRDLKHVYMETPLVRESLCSKVICAF